MNLIELNKSRKTQQSHKHRAFTLIELSISLAIVGLLIGITMSSASMINNARIASARSTVAESPVPKINNLLFWLETCNKSAFAVGSGTNLRDVQVMNNGEKIAVWNNINSQIPTSLRNNFIQVDIANQPTLALKSINDLPAVRFRGSSFLENSKLFMNRSQLTIFIVARRNAYVANSSLVNGRNATDINFNDNNRTDSLVAFLESSGTSLRSSRNNTPLSNGDHPGNNIAFIAATVFDGANNTIYMNGKISNSSASTGSFFMQQLRIGCRIGNSGSSNTCYNGDLSEVIIYDRALNDSERKLVEKYLSKKFKIKVV